MGPEVDGGMVNHHGVYRIYQEEGLAMRRGKASGFTPKLSDRRLPTPVAPTTPVWAESSLQQ
jgi:hypothetical protein